MTLITARNLPKHVAITMDGNGRWAELRGLPRSEGHRAGSEAVRRIVRAARRLGVEQLTLYAFSEQNWGRPHDEVSSLMGLLCEFLISEREEILSNAIRLRAIGNTERLPPHVRATLDSLVGASTTNSRMVLSLALSYGGREEIVAAARTLAQNVRRGIIDPSDVTEASLRALIPSSALGDPDLMIRTGGEVRISNFLLWGAAYCELHFEDVLWPDFQVEHLHRAIASFQRRERRFGLVPARAPNPSPLPSSLAVAPCPTSHSGS